MDALVWTPLFYSNIDLLRLIKLRLTQNHLSYLQYISAINLDVRIENFASSHFT